MKCTFMKNAANKFEAHFVIDNQFTESKLSSKYTLSGLASIQFRADIAVGQNKLPCQGNIFIRLVNSFQGDGNLVIKIVSKELFGQRVTLLSSCYDKTPWKCIHTYNTSSKNYGATLSFNVAIELNVMAYPKFASLHEDIELTDIKLSAEDGVVSLHRMILAASSPVMKTMLVGEWKETKEGHVKVANTSVKTLEHLKDYLYLDKLPDTLNDLEPLLDLACCYMMSELMVACSTNILLYLTSNDVLRVICIAMKYKLKKLLRGILMCANGGLIDEIVVSSTFGDDWI